MPGPPSCHGPAAGHRHSSGSRSSPKASSSARTRATSGLAALLAYCEARAESDPPAAVVVWDGDRLSRADSIRTAVVLDRLITAGVSKLLTADGWIDLESDIDRLMFNLKQVLSRAAYSKNLSKNVTRSALRRAQEGRWVCARPPYWPGW
jgi:DNA invertase Pin-like site-specific DNA recombinase